MPCALVGALLLTGASGDGEQAKILLALALILVGAKVVGDLFNRLGQPAVLGELIAGVILGNLTLVGVGGFEFISEHESFALLASLGVILLLFQVGLESDLTEMARTGVAAVLVAIVGVVVPVALGYGVHAWLVPDAEWYVHLFIGAILAATSVGITARVLQDLGRIATPTARVILGAAVIDDVLGLILLAVVKGIVIGTQTGDNISLLEIAAITGKAFLFLLGAVMLGRPASRVLFKVATTLRARGVLVAISLGFCFAVAGLAQLAGLDAIVGAFAAGLVLETVAYEDLETREAHGLEDQLGQIAQFLVPVFFVYVGTRVDLGALGSASTLFLAAMLTIAAVIGKQACSLAAVGDGVNRIGVGLGMIPRGEVGLIFATVGIQVGVVSQSTYASIVVMVMVTTMVTPPILAWWLRRHES
jgi:Kef-type K+ transport system membrane component KefB